MIKFIKGGKYLDTRTNEEYKWINGRGYVNQSGIIAKNNIDYSKEIHEIPKYSKVE